MTNIEYEKLKEYIITYQNTNDKQVLEKIIDINSIYIQDYLIKCSYSELEINEILSIIILSVIKFVKYVDLSLDLKQYEKKIKNTIKKSVFDEVRQCRKYNDKESYERYKKRHKNGQENSYIDPNTETFENIKIMDYLSNLPIKEQQFIMLKYGLVGEEKNVLELSKLYNKPVDDIKTEEVKILRKLKNDINRNLKD